uniref:Peptide Ctri10261 n=1 Tax=Chaerilus tricostatus TaxID=1055734 RepID=NDB4U_CHATC|nr:RecName: Full=Peptide Ctri10261; Flags: Precursor [Chaerilus tricostatus]
MKIPLILVTIAIILLMVPTESDAFDLGGLIKGVVDLFGRRSLKNRDYFDYMQDPSLSNADLRELEELLEDY